MKKRDFKTAAHELSIYTKEINDEIGRNIKKLDKIERQQEISASAYMPIFLAALAEMQKAHTKAVFENNILNDKREKQEFDEMINNLSVRLACINEAEEQGIEISNENFEHGLYQFVASAENIQLDGNEDMKEVIEKLESKYNETLKSENTEVYNEA